MDQSRRLFLLTGATAAVSFAFIGMRGFSRARADSASQAAATPQAPFAVTHSDAQWHKLLSPGQYEVLRQEGTEQPFSSPLNNEHRKGVFSCAGCALDLYASDTKYDSGTGWPSFWSPLDKAVLETSDRSFGMTRTEVRCSRCGGHLGHVFDDGPQPTGLRYCMNGVAMGFRPVTA